MELSAGTRVGPYEIQKRIGAGGMGVVYRALDSRLGRSVAIKVLPEALRDDGERLRRFEQEARTIGGLNHPNLVILHDVGRHDGVPYLVTELLEGHSLRQLIDRSPPSTREAVKLAAEIARGLSAAHGAGVVHRDIKPDNIYVTDSGRVKILDFGIAKLRRDAPGDGDPGSAATMAGQSGATSATGTGMVIGTPGYMAPEQVAGGAVDVRADLFALGVVLYEMLARRRPFESETNVEESYAILKLEPATLPTTVPAALGRVVTRCLEKRPDARFQSAADLAFALDAIDVPEAMPSRADLTPPPSARTDVQSAPTLAAPQVVAEGTVPIRKTPVTELRPRSAVGARVAIGLAAVCVVLAGALVVVWRRSPSAPPTTSVFPSLIEAGPAWRRITYHSQAQWFARFDRSGRSVVHSLRVGEEWRIVRTQIDPLRTSSPEGEGRVLDVSKRDELLVRLPDKTDVGGTLARAMPSSGSATPVAKGVIEAVWGPDGEQIAITRRGPGGATLEYPIGKTIVTHKTGEIATPRISHDGKHIAFVEQNSSPDTHGRVVIVDLDGLEVSASPAFDAIDGLAWPPGDAEVDFGAEGEIRALSLDGRERVVLRGPLRMRVLDIADDGRLLVAPTDSRIRMFRITVDENGHQSGANAIRTYEESTIQSISSDGSVLGFIQSGLGRPDSDGFPAFAVRTGGEPFRIGSAQQIAIMPDGNSAIELCAAPPFLRKVALDEVQPKPIPTGAIAKPDLGDLPAVSADGRHVLVRAAEKDKAMRLWLLDLQGGAPVPIGPDPAPTGRHPISPDGRQFAVSDSRGGLTLFATAGGAIRHLDDTQPLWPLGFSTDGRYLFAMNAHNWPRVISRVDLQDLTKRDEWARIDPEDRPKHSSVAIDGDGAHIVYDLPSETSDLYVIEPPKAQP